MRLWDRLFNRSLSTHDLDTFVNPRRVFHIDKGSINNIGKNLVYTDHLITYQTMFFAGVCIQTYNSIYNKTTIEFQIGKHRNLPNYYRDNMKDLIIDVKEFRSNDFVFKVTASQYVLDINFKKEVDNISFLDSYQQLEIMKKHNGLIKRIKQFVKANKHLEEHECINRSSGKTIVVDISHI
jgi:hypothetical protein